jgi:hypothetical protein
MMVDPPSGWKYGFPRNYNAEKDGDLGEFLLHHGYPVDDLDFALRYIRFIGTDEEISELSS